MGVDIEKGILKIGTPLVVFDKERKSIRLGKVASIEANHKPLTIARKNDGILFKRDHFNIFSFLFIIRKRCHQNRRRY
jgi:hypothetical protein